MKKYILLILMFVALKSECNIISSISIKPKPIHIELSFDIASRKSNCQSEFGFCNPVAIIGRASGRTASGYGWVENGMLFLQLQKNYIADALNNELAELQYIELEDGVSVPEVWLVKMGIIESLYIPEGRYVIVNENDYFQITFNLR